MSTVWFSFIIREIEKNIWGYIVYEIKLTNTVIIGEVDTIFNIFYFYFQQLIDIIFYFICYFILVILISNL